MKKFLSIVSQRVVIVSLLLALQVAVFGIVLTQFSNYAVTFYWICVLISFLVSLKIAGRKGGKLAYKVTLIIPILVFPVFGGLLYLVLGGANPSKKVQSGIQHMYQVYEAQFSSMGCGSDALASVGPDAVQQARYLEKSALFPVYTGTETRYFPTGESFFPVCLAELKKAKRYILIEYFIIAEGDVWDAVLKVLTEKAAQGVDVRVMYDDVGSVRVLPANYHKVLEARGIKCGVFQPFRPVLSIHQNNRDHRKLCIIDGQVGFVGGLNMADEYANRIKRFGYWKDSALMLRGGAVWSLTVIFLCMWEFVREERVCYQDFRAEAPQIRSCSGFVQPYADTPLDSEAVFATLCLQMITKAKKYLYLTTPYLIIDETIAMALFTAAKSGVDVRIMTPHIPDKPTVFEVTRSQYLSLLESGVKIYEFLPGFLHSKTMVSDDLCASVGSCNLDYRSFYLQFENGVWICDDPSVLAVRDDFLSMLPHCRQVRISDCKNVPVLRQAVRVILRMFSPLL